MRLIISLICAGGLLVLAPAGVWAESPATTTQHLEHLVIENADTPAEHEALARYFRMKAGDARSIAAEHRSMAKSYGMSPGKLGDRQQKQKHCERIAELNEELAAEYEKLAAAEEAAAKM